MIDQSIIEKLTAPGPRLPWIASHLTDNIWSKDKFSKLGPADYLQEGEKQVFAIEELVSAAADRVYDELSGIKAAEKSLLNFLETPENSAVIFDGLSLREIPMLLSLAAKSGLKAIESSWSLSAAPSETIDFIAMELGLPRGIGPSQLPSRQELKSKGVKAIYASNHSAAIDAQSNLPALIWSSFPDNTYTDSGARFASHFENISNLLEVAWMNTVQAIKGKKRILVTSDHGYIYFGAGFDSPRSPSEMRQLNECFGNDRNIQGLCGFDSHDVYYHSENDVSILKGRIKTHGSGPAGQKLYKHGGLSLMECIVPWLIFEA